MRFALRRRLVRDPWIVFAALAFSLPFGAQAFDIAPVPISMTVAGRPVTITLSGTISRRNEQSLDLDLRADLTDLQSQITPLLKAALNRSNRCGESIAVERGILAPAGTSALLTVQLRFEKRACSAVDKTPTRLLSRNDFLHLRLTPHVDQSGQTFRLNATAPDGTTEFRFGGDSGVPPA